MSERKKRNLIISIKGILLLLFLVAGQLSFSTSKNTLKEIGKITDTAPSIRTHFNPSLTHKIDSIIKRESRWGHFNGSILVAHNNEVIFNGNYGYADIAKKTEIDSTSTFQLASVSKQFTATAILLLSERKFLNLTDTVTRFFPNFPYKKVTIYQLLNHTSGIPKYFWLAEHKWLKEKAPSNLEMMALLEKENLPPFFKPGAMFDYSNSGYMVLASIIEKVTKTSYRKFLAENIFSVAGMSHTYVYRFQHDTIPQNQLYGYRNRGRRHIKIPNTINDGIVGDKNIYSTAEDLIKWITSLNAGKIISKESLALMYTKGKTKYKHAIPYGYGFRIEDKDSKIIYHDGKWNGFRTSIKQYPEDNLIIILLEHSSYRTPNNLIKRIHTTINNSISQDIYYL